MKKSLENDDINLLISIAESTEKNMLYTNSEKYSYILEKNKTIELLKEKLDLSML